MPFGIPRGVRTVSAAAVLAALTFVGSACGDRTGSSSPAPEVSAGADTPQSVVGAAKAAAESVAKAANAATAAKEAALAPSGDPELDKLDGDLKALESEMASLDTAIAATQGGSK